MTLSCAIGFKECCWPNPWNFCDDLCSLSLKTRHKQLQKSYHQGPNSCSWYILKLFFVISFPLGLLGGNKMYKYLTAMPQVPWLWKLFYCHEAKQKSWLPFSVDKMVVEHCGMTLAAVTWRWPQPLPMGGWWWQNGHILILQQWLLFLLCWAFSAIRWDLKIPIGSRNTELQNTENSIKTASVIYVLSEHKGHCATSFLPSAYAHTV